MEANELRIGNYFIGSDKKQYQIKTGDDFYYAGNYKPIPLTEEWLLRFGYVKDEDQSSHGYQDFTKNNEYIRLSGSSTFYRDGSASLGNKKNLINVHQLQNLYFALTGEELIAKN